MRIITGKVKGLRLKTAAGLATRPTSDRVKESLFSILNGLVDFAEVDAVLDVFAGTGALGLEALSRGANSAVFVDTVADVLVENVRRAKFDGVCQVLREDFVRALKRISRQGLQFDLIFTDPPYGKNLAQASVSLVARMNLLKPSGLLVVEHGGKEILSVPASLDCVRKVDYGHTTTIEIFQMKGSDL